MILKTYKELKVWQQSFDLCKQVYRITKIFPKEEIYGLTSQIRRAAVSIPSNIAEGYGRKTTPEYLRGLYIAYGSLCELETQIMLARELEFTQSDEADKISDTIGNIERMLKALIRKLEEKTAGTRG